MAHSAVEQIAGSVPRSTGPVKLVAVIDIGTAAIRMAVAEIHPDETIRTLDTLTQAVNIGKSVFTTGLIEKSIMEDCVRILKSYRQVLNEYGIEQSDRIRVVATSAVREASNRLAFIDRIYSATGFEVEPIDAAEVNRITYLGIQPLLQDDPTFDLVRTIVTEIGGGSTELLLVENEDVILSHSYRLGSIRLREQLEAYRASAPQVRKTMESHIKRTIDQIVQQVPPDGRVEMIAIGGDVRFAASHILPDRDPSKLSRIPVGALERFTNRILSLSEDGLVQKYHLAFPDAETVGPSLLAYVLLARAYKLDSIFVTNVNLRDGLLQDLATRGAWTEDFSKQVIRSATDLGRKFKFDEAHGRHVAELCKLLFKKLQSEHRLEPRYELILYVAALLHEIGLYINTSSHHKHSMYLIMHSDLFGLSKKDVQVVGLIARYHRRATPKPNHPGYATMDRESRIAVSKMAAMLRVADALDRSHSQRVREIECLREDGRMVIMTPDLEDVSIEQLALKQKGTLFDSIFGMKVLLRKSRRK